MIKTWLKNGKLSVSVENVFTGLTKYLLLCILRLEINKNFVSTSELTETPDDDYIIYSLTVLPIRLIVNQTKISVDSFVYNNSLKLFWW